MPLFSPYASLAALIGVLWAAREIPGAGREVPRGPGPGDLELTGIRVTCVPAEPPEVGFAWVIALYPEVRNMTSTRLSMETCYALIELENPVEVCRGLGSVGAEESKAVGLIGWFEPRGGGFVERWCGPKIGEGEYPVRVRFYSGAPGDAGYSGLLRGAGLLLGTGEFLYRYPEIY